MLKKLAIVAATLFVGGICAGFFLYDYVAGMTVAQIEEAQQ